MVRRWTQMGSAMVEAFNSFDGAPVGPWVQYEDYQALERELAEERTAKELWKEEWRQAVADKNVAPPEAGTFEVTSAMEDAGMTEVRQRFNLGVTRASVSAIFKAMLKASHHMNTDGPNE